VSLLDRFRLDGRVAIVTGASRGIGFGVAAGLADAGCRVVMAARRRDVLEQAAAALAAAGKEVLAVPTDVVVAGELDALVAKTIEAFGRLDVVVNNAGGAPPTIALGLTDEDFEAAYRFNVTAALHLSRAAAPHMKRAGGGAIVNVSSAMSHLVDSGFVAYGAAKAALNHMTRLLAAEWAPVIRVNAIACGAVNSDALEMIAADPTMRAAMVQKHPMARLGEPADIAAAAVYLCSPASAWVTGKVLEVDGGAVTSTMPFRIPGGLED
jgi:7-alpha-hydroxysteroid dehydrogenase